MPFGALTSNEKSFTTYDKDSLANAIYLYESGDNYFEVRNNAVWLITNYHAKVKILDEKGFNEGEIAIPFYHNKKRSEYINKIKAITHNGVVKTSLNSSEIYLSETSENWSEKKFAFPNIKVGSILEYTYEIQSPFFFNLNGWDFQSTIPKLYTEYTAKIPGNWKYNRTLSGDIELDTNEADIKSACFTIPGGINDADCEVVKYTMSNVPAFAEDEEYMLSGNNYRSKLKFELQEYQNFKGERHRYTKTWEDVDKEFRLDKDIGRQLKKKNFFEKNVPESLFSEADELIKAKNIYAFVQKHFTWNGKNGIWRNNRVKNAFETKKGNAAEINIALINLLNVGGINADLMLSATRNKGLPKTSHPVMSDFNYVLAKVNINNKDYLLDATDKEMPFGMLPFKCLNYYGRVMDFDDKSYWFDIVPDTKNKRIISVKMKLSTDGEETFGNIASRSTGYYYVNQKRLLNSKNKEAYLSDIEESFKDEIKIEKYNAEDLPNKRVLTEKFEYKIESVNQEGNIYLDAFLIKFFNSNPFKTKQRSYPIDFGYLKNNTYQLNIEVPKGYRVKSLPDSKLVSLAENSGVLRFNCKEVLDNQISVIFDFKLMARQYNNEYYEGVKEFFQAAVDIQTKSYIILE